MIAPTVLATPADVADHYDDLDGFYREIWGEHVHHGLWRTGRESSQAAVRELVLHLARQIGLQPGDEVVDVGCGYGGTARLLASEFRASVTGLTVSSAQFQYATAPDRGLTSTQYLLRDWLANDLEADRFDRAIAIESTEHMADKTRVFAELYRVLKPGGTTGIYAWIARDNASAWEVRHLLEPICREGRLPGMGTETEYRAFLGAAGFAEIQVEDLSRGVRRTWSHCAARVGRRLVSQRRYRRYLFDGRSRNRIFAASLLRIWAAYRVGAMRYLLFTARKPPRQGQP